jgi:ATP-dependent DNA helicase Rep/DNA helicase-2/ATP-dependent DNA helicase PcrA
MAHMRVDLSELNSRQREAAETIEGPVLVLSGAGTGKTRTITYRIANMLGKGIPASNILAVTFTNKAAREMQERIRAVAGEAAREMQISTFHSLGLRMVREHADYFSLPSAFTIYDQADQLSVVRKGLRQLRSTSKKFNPEKILWEMQRSRDAKYQVNPACEDEDDNWAVRLVWDFYLETLRKCGAVDFEDLLYLPLRLLKEKPDALEEYRGRFRYCLVDEYQDTNEAQFEIMRLLTMKSRNLCVVGDDDQSIYGWRGAQIRNILDFEKTFPEAKVIRLEENYRSSQTILDAANCVIKNNRNRKSKKLWTSKNAGRKIRVYAAEDEETEAQILADSLIDLHMKGVEWGDCAVLMRMNTQAVRFEEALRRNRVPYVLKGTLSFMDRKEMRDFICYLKLLINQQDEEAINRVINVPPRKIGATSLKKLSDFAEKHNWDLYTALGHIEECSEIKGPTRDAMYEFHSLIERYKVLMRPGNFARFVGDLWEDLAYEEELKELETSERQSRLGNVSALIDSIRYYESQGANTTLADYLQQLHLQEEDEEEDDDKEMQDRKKVKMMTIHSSKGLEFPYVFLVGAEDGVLPHERSVMEGSLEEERRLFYVAVTRAKEDLVISYAANKIRYGQAIACDPSSFIGEIDEDLLEIHDDSVREEATEEEADMAFARLKALFAKDEEE